MSTEKTRHKKQAPRFAAVGVLNTLFDFTVFNIFALIVGVNPVIASIIAASLAMAVSFYLNKKFVFSNNTMAAHRQAVLFIIVTAFGVYVLQSLFIEAFANRWPGFLIDIHTMLSAVGFRFSQDFVVVNGAKAIGVSVSMIWNYLLYDSIVFKERS